MKENWVFLKDAMQNKNTGTWVSRISYNKYSFMKVQEWTEGYLSIMIGMVNLGSKKINKNEACLFSGIDAKEKEKLVESVLSYYGNDDFVETVDWVDEREIEEFLKQKKSEILL